MTRWIFCNTHQNKALEICWFKWTWIKAWPGRRSSYWQHTWTELSREMSCNPLFFHHEQQRSILMISTSLPKTKHTGQHMFPSELA